MKEEVKTKVTEAVFRAEKELSENLYGISYHYTFDNYIVLLDTRYIRIGQHTKCSYLYQTPES